MDTDELKKKEVDRKCCCGYKVTICVLTPLGILIAVAANFLPKIYSDTVKKQLVLLKGTESYSNWNKAPSPIYMTYYIFNYTNAQDIMKYSKLTIKPSVSQIGPFVYREVRNNDVLDYNEHNITYLQNYSYIFERTLSCSTCDENSTVYIPSISAMAVLKDIAVKIKNPGFFTKFGTNTFLDAYVELFRPLTVREVLWGYEDPFLVTMKHLEVIFKFFGFKVPAITKIALQFNGTEGANQMGNVTLLTGKDNINDVQRIVKWRGLDTAPYWLTKYGRMINGTDGTRAPPFLKRDYRWYVFVTQLCRSLYFTYKEDVEFQGIKMYRFTTTAELFMNASVNPDNKAFCSANDTCWGTGLLCISKCMPGGVPIFMSAPHFFNGDPKFVERIDGLKPNESLHSSIADVEPITGVTMRAYKRLQVNVMGQRSWVDVSKRLQHEFNFLPVLIIVEAAVIDDVTASKFRDMVYLPRKFMIGIAPYCIMAVGIIMVLIALLCAYKLVKMNYRNTHKSLLLLDDEGSDICDEAIPWAVN